MRTKEEGLTLLASSANNINNPEVVSFLIDQYPEALNEKDDKFGNTPLEIAKEFNEGSNNWPSSPHQESVLRLFTLATFRQASPHSCTHSPPSFFFHSLIPLPPLPHFAPPLLRPTKLLMPLPINLLMRLRAIPRRLAPGTFPQLLGSIRVCTPRERTRTP